MQYHPRVSVFIGCLASLLFAAVAAAAETVDLPADVVQDKIRGGLLGHLLGDLNGLPHEMKYIDEPGKVEQYTPGLPQGAWTDDDTDIEWVYIIAMQQRKMSLLPPKEISALWQKHVNRAIWCANQYARQLMDLGIDPPLCGQIHFNPWSDFNLSGQFVCESWGLIAPAMTQTAAKIGLNYVHAAIDGEPAQTTQLFDAMIATAFVTDDMQKILDAGAAAVDPKSVVRQVLDDVRRWHAEHPQDWRATRRLVKEKYSRFKGAMRDRNGYELNMAGVIAALLYGRGDFVPTAITAFNFGWDADNNAATACTIVGVLKGQKWMAAQGWDIKDQYRNTTRDAMPNDETITRFGDRLIALAEQTIEQQGGQKIVQDGKTFYRIRVERPANLERLPDVPAQFARLQREMRTEIEEGVLRGNSPQQRARAAYLAICLDLAEPLRQKHPEPWAKALTALDAFPKVAQVLFFESPTPAGDTLRRRALAAGWQKPAKKEKIW